MNRTVIHQKKIVKTAIDSNSDQYSDSFKRNIEKGCVESSGSEIQHRIKPEISVSDYGIFCVYNSPIIL
jgi:hypothetical protein